MQLTDWLLDEVVLLLIGLTKIWFYFNHPFIIESPLRLWAQSANTGRMFALSSPGVASIPCWNFRGDRNRVGILLSYLPAGQHMLAKSIPFNRFLGSSKV